MRTVQRKGRAASTHLDVDLVPFAGGPADENVGPSLWTPSTPMFTLLSGCVELGHGLAAGWLASGVAPSTMA